MKPFRLFLVFALSCWTAANAAAAAEAPPLGGVTLSATASTEVPRDLLSVTLSTTREGVDAASVQAALKQALDTALVQARQAARPQQLEVRTGHFSLFPKDAPKGGLSGWRGTAELVIEGRDMPAIAALAGRMGGLTVARVAYGVSPEQREKVAGEVMAQAVARFRARAAELARLFSYSSYVLREVNVSDDDMRSAAPVSMFRAKAMSAASDEPLPVEAGKAQLSVTINGAVQLLGPR